MDECKYFSLKIDPFRPQKLQSLVQSKTTIESFAEFRKTNLNDITIDCISDIIRSTLWSNTFDLSRYPDGVTSVNQIICQIFNKNNDILINNIPEIELLLEKLKQKPGPISIITDNCGIEIVSDLFLAEFLVHGKFATQITLHIKFHPTFVSDVTENDIKDTLDYVSRHFPEMGSKWKSLFENKTFVLFTHPYYNSYEPFWIIPLQIYEIFKNSCLVISKGDANTRRFHGDLSWSFTEPTSKIISYFPTDLILIRTLKSETVSGLSEETIEKFVKSNENSWYHSGKYGTIQLIKHLSKYFFVSPFFIKGFFVANYECGFSFLCLNNAHRPTPATFTTLKRTPGISPFDFPLLPKPAIKTSSVSLINNKEPSQGTKAATFFPFLTSWTRTALRIAEFGCLASIPIRSTTNPLA